MGFRIPLSSCGGSLFISVLLRKVALHRAKELLLLLDVLLLSPSACLPVKPDADSMCAPFTFSGVKTTRGSITPVFFFCLVVCEAVLLLSLAVEDALL